MNAIVSAGLNLNKFLHFTIEGNPVPTDADLWGVALSAMYLGGGFALSPTSELRAHSRWVLREFWGIDGKSRVRTGEPAGGVETASAADNAKQFASIWLNTHLFEHGKVAKHDQAIAVLEWLLHEGHRASPQYVTGDPDVAQDMLAWDLARTVMVARYALCTGYLSDAETRAYVRVAAINAQQGFSSWEDYGRHYVKGLARWAGKPVPSYEKTVSKLLKNPDSPWRRLDWHERLTEPGFDGIEKGPLGVFTYLRRFWAGKLVLMAMLLVVTTTVLLSLQLKDNIVYRNKTKLLTPIEAFNRVEVQFNPTDSGFSAFFSAPKLHRVTEFHYGVNRDIPDQTPKSRFHSSDGYPFFVSLPKTATFITVQARFEDGTLSPIRRIEVQR